MFEFLKQQDPSVHQMILKEIERQNGQIELIASENFAPLPVLEAAGSPLTNKYAEGYPGARWYGGCEFVDEIEELARERVKELFGCEHANVQPHSGSQANMAVMLAVLNPKDTILSMDLACGGHLSHGHPLNFSGKIYNVVSYGVDPETEMLDYGKIRDLAVKSRPKLIIAGASAYPRVIDFDKFRQIADEVGACLLVDMAHFAGIVAAKLFPNPCTVADFVTSTTHKTLRGPRAGFILCRKKYAKKIDTAVFPGIQGGPLMHVIAAKAVGFGLALKPEFVQYQRSVLDNARAFAGFMKDKGYRIVSGTTDTHLFLVDLRTKGLTGKECTSILEKVNITVNKNLIPYDPNPPVITSGIRIGTPAITGRGMKTDQMREITELIDAAVENKNSPDKLEGIKGEVSTLLDRFPLYPELNEQG